MKRAVLAVLCAGAVFSCDGASKYEQLQVGVTPTGTIFCRVLNGVDNAPLEGVTILSLSNDKTATTDSNGVAKFTELVAGSTHFFVMTKEGYVRQVRSTSITSSAGNSPFQGASTTFSTTLYKADGSMKGHILLPSGRPAVGAKLAIDQARASAGESVLTTQTGADGSFEFMGLATAPQGMTHRLTIQWFDENSDGQPDYAGTIVDYTVYPGLPTRVLYTYTPAFGGQSALASNIFDGELLPSEDITMTFALPVQATNFNGMASRAFTLNNITRVGEPEVAVDATWMNQTSVSLKPVAALIEGNLYRLTVSITNLNATGQQTSIDYINSFTFQVRAMSPTAITAQVKNFTVLNASPISGQARTVFDSNSSHFELAWDAVAGAISYVVYAKDTTNNTAYVRIATVTDGSPRVTYTVGLAGTTFEPNVNDSVSDPLGFKNAITFTVIPVDIYGNQSPLAMAPTVEVKDNLGPTINPANVSVAFGIVPGTGVVDAINDDTTPSIIQLRVRYSEPMDPATAPTFIGAATVTQSFAWETANGASTTGLLTITIPAGGDVSGPFIIRGGKDYAGNALRGGDVVNSLSGRKELGTNWNFEDAMGTCALTGWNPTQTGGGMPQPSTVNGAGRTGRCAALIGTPPGALPQNGLARLSQDISLPTLPMGSPWKFEARAAARYVYFSPSGTAPSVDYRCRVTDTSNANPTPILSATLSSTSVSTNFATNQTGGFESLHGTTVRIACELETATANAVNAAMYIDDVGITLVKPGQL